MSGEKVPYHLRPNKFVERALFLELLGHVDRNSPISGYLYVSFAGAYLEDFKVIHASFGNRKMLSLEEQEWVYQRQRFNVPYGCVQCRNKTSQQFVTDYNDLLGEFGNPPVLIWLDYAAPAKLREQLTEFESLVAKLKEYDILKITLNANPRSLDRETKDNKDNIDAEELRKIRLEVVKTRIGDYLPNDIKADDLQHVRYPDALLRAVHKAAANGMRGRANSVFHPLAAYVYEDSHQMLTVTGILLDKDNVTTFLQKTGLDRNEFATNQWDNPIRINVPYLSPREKFYLDSLMFKQTVKNDPSKLKGSIKLEVTLADTDEKNRVAAQRYLKFYRFYPHYHRIHY